MDTVLHRTRRLSTASSHIRRDVVAKFVTVGAFGTALYYLVLIMLVEMSRVPVMTATSLAFALVVGVNYVLHRRWTFQSPVTHARALLPFVMMSIAGFGINAGVMAFGLALGIQYMLVQALAIALVVAWNYIFTVRIFKRPLTSSINSRKGSCDDPT